ncbi:MFS transporter [Ottowia thiooxydans]|uniref:DHA1 family multidrug resistance protein-like MFS transporter n=1 Tax=Ottowia thiooxydans TaxID=219182 RepID=A0ABV2QDW1_9BURK
MSRSVALEPPEVVTYRQILRVHPALIVIMLSVAGHMVMNSALAPVLSVYAGSFGVNEIAIGLVMTIFGVGRLLADIPAGLLAEKQGRKRWLWMGPLIAGSASIGAALTQDYQWLVALRFLQGIGSGIYMTVAAIVCADLSTPATRGRVMALYQAAVLTGAGLGPAIGGISSDLGGIQATFWISALIAFSTVAYVWVRMPETNQANAKAWAQAQGQAKDSVSATRGSVHGMAALMAVVGALPLLMLMIVNFGVFFSRSGGQWTALPLLGTEQFGLSAGRLGLILALSSLLNLVALPWAGSLGDRFGNGRVILVSSSLTAVALMLVAFSVDVAMFSLGTVLLGVAGSFVAPAIAAFAAQHAPNSQFGPTMGVLRFGGDLGFVCGPLLLGAVMQFFHASYAGALLVNAAIVVGATVAFAWVLRRSASPASIHSRFTNPPPKESS